jgi:uncharacterized protein YoaH (UPF0181 family)
MKDKLKEEAYKALREKSKEAFDIFCKEIIRPDDDIKPDEIESVQEVYCTGFETGYALALMEEIREEKIKSGQYAHFNTNIH